MLISLNDQPVNDIIDYQFHQASSRVKVRFSQDGQIINKNVYKNIDADLGLIFYPDKITHCRNNCIFCFVHNNPEGLRQSLYIKDDDYRLSFLHGNFVTLTNIDNSEINRIISIKLSPLYISVQATDEKTRQILFGRASLPSLMPILEKLASGGIYFHSQVVIVPGINDGETLNQTAADLARLRPYAASMAVVPVGLTKNSARVSQAGLAIKPVNISLARNLIEQVNHFRNSYGDRNNKFAYAADELFIMANQDIPTAGYYDDFPQIENGVGLVRQFLDSIPRRLSNAAKRALAETGLWITGSSMLNIWQKDVFPEYGFSLKLLPVTNRLFGSRVTVTGLLAGHDILENVKRAKLRSGPIILPPNCLNGDGKFIDDMTPMDLANQLSVDIIQGTYDFGETIRLLM
jgi:putative radical SAM enzyme (TIGR03279 family)